MRRFKPNSKNQREKIQIIVIANYIVYINLITKFIYPQFNNLNKKDSLKGYFRDKGHCYSRTNKYKDQNFFNNKFKIKHFLVDFFSRAKVRFIFSQFLFISGFLKYYLELI